MATIIDNIQLDETNVEFNCAADFLKHTDRLLYLTGKAGTGKTTFLMYLRATTTKNTVILAPTGFAAINAGGLMQKMKKANYSAKSKDVQPHPKAVTVAPHLLLPQHTKTLLSL